MALLVWLSVRGVIVMALVEEMEVLLPLNPLGNSPSAPPRYPLYKRLGGPQSQSGLYGEEKIPLPLPGIELQISSLQNITVPTVLPWLLHFFVLKVK
jgi:hypothetical protein